MTEMDPIPGGKDSHEIMNQKQMEEMIYFLEKYKWVYDFQLTRFVVDRIWEHIPAEWLSFLANLSTEEMNEIPFGLIKDGWPLSFKDFVKTAQKYSMDRMHLNVEPSIQLTKSACLGMNPKKIHEVVEMSGVVDKVCKATGSNMILDIGSGLGYLDEVLHTEFGYKVIGVESQASRTHGAECRAEKKGVDKDYVIAITHEMQDTAESTEELYSLLTNHSKDVKDVCMISLHSCGDLTPTMLKMFCNTPWIKSLVCVSCCYHRMTKKGDDFNQFPMSQTMRKALLDKRLTSPEWRLSLYALRLAAQETRSRWKNQTSDDHIYHSKNVAYRGLLECIQVAEKDRIKRKLKSGDSFDVYLDKVIVNDFQAKEKLKGLHDEMSEYFKYIEPFTCLQVIMQPVLERCVLEDRVMYLKENGVNAYLEPVFDDQISPRNIAIIASKTDFDSQQ